MATSSYMRTTEGRRPRAMVARTVAIPSGTDRTRPPRSGAWPEGRELEARAGDDAERPLGADEELRQLGPHRVPGDADGLDHVPVGVDAEGEDEILDLAVARREHPGAARGDVAADRRQIDRSRIVRKHEPSLVQRALEPLAVDARLGRHRQRLLVHLDDAVEACEVERMPPLRTAPPWLPEPPPRGTTGRPRSLAKRSTARRRSSAGRTTFGTPSGLPLACAASAFQ